MTNVYYNQLLQICRQENDKGVPELLKTRWGDCKYTALHIAALHGDDKMIKYLKRIHFPFDAVDKDGYSALHLIFSESIPNLNTVQCLLDCGADVNQVERSKDTPLHIACASGAESDIIKFLLKKGAAVNQPNSDGETPLTLALRSVGDDIDNNNLREDGFTVVKLIADKMAFKMQPEDLEMLNDLLERVDGEFKVILSNVRDVMERKLDKQEPSAVLENNNQRLNIKHIVPTVIITPPSPR